MKITLKLFLVFAISLSALSLWAGDPKSEFKKGGDAYLKHDYAKAQKHFEAVTKDVPDFIDAWEYLGHSLFYQQKFKEAAIAYEKVLSLQKKKPELDQTQVRLVIDQLGMAYGISGNLEQAKSLFEENIKADPEYPLFYYNLACTYGEMNDLENALKYLKLGYERRKNMLAEENYPNPRTDSSFKRFLGNEKFEAAMKEMGYTS